jgi:hypothetical protein
MHSLLNTILAARRPLAAKKRKERKKKNKHVLRNGG